MGMISIMKFPQSFNICPFRSSPRDGQGLKAGLGHKGDKGEGLTEVFREAEVGEEVVGEEAHHNSSSSQSHPRVHSL